MGIKLIIVVFLIIYSQTIEKIYSYLVRMTLKGEDIKVNFINEDKRIRLSSLYIIFVNTIYIIIFSLNKEGLFNFLLFQLLLFTSLSDLYCSLVSDKVFKIFFLIVLLLSILLDVGIFSNLIEALKMFILMYSIYILSNLSIGGADVRLYTVISYFLGLTTSIYILFLSSWICLLYILWIWISKKYLIRELPYIPFINLAVIFYIIGKDLIKL